MDLGNSSPPITLPPMAADALPSIPVVWHTDIDGVRNRGYWDQGWLEGIFDSSMWLPYLRFTFSHRYGFGYLTPADDGAVVIIPARHYVNDIARIQEGISQLSWVLLILTGDEEGAFPLHDLHHPNMRVWVQTPYPDRHSSCFPVPDFSPPDTRDFFRQWMPHKILPWSFMGQVNNARREECVAALSQRHDGLLLPTPGFTLGLPRPGYLSILAGSKVAPAPSGPFTPDTFRLFEALDAGCIPIADSSAPNTGPIDYWTFLFSAPPPFPVVDVWHPVPIDEALADWPASANRISSWWQDYKRRFVVQFYEDIATLSQARIPSSPITVVIPTSPIPSHPSLHIISATVASVREQLPDSEILILCDGIRDEQAHYRDAYEEYLRQLFWTANNVWTNVLPIRYDSHHHQSNLLDRALFEVHTPYILFVEHDTPITGPIPWDDLVEVLRQDKANVIRLHHEASILDAHRHLMLDPSPQLVAGVPLSRTVQWSQRPHLASVAYYREMLDDHFNLPEERWMIEDRLHSVILCDYDDYGMAGWDRHKLWIYTPSGDIKRSTHLDGRESDPKFVDH